MLEMRRRAHGPNQVPVAALMCQKGKLDKQAQKAIYRTDPDEPITFARRGPSDRGPPWTLLNTER